MAKRKTARNRAAGQKRPCPCCDKSLSERQITRHLTDYERRLEVPSSDSDDLDSGLDNNNNDSDDDDDESSSSSLEGVGMQLELDDELAQDLDNTNVDPPANVLPANVPPADMPPDNMVFNPPVDDGPARLMAQAQIFDQLYRILRNPPVAFDNWDDPASPDPSAAGDDPADNESVGSNQDPEFNEREVPPQPNADDEPEINPDLLRAFLEEHLMEMDEDEWEELHSRELSTRDRKTFELLGTRLRTHFSRQTWNDLCLGVCAEHHIPSEFIAWQRLRILSGLETRTYDCCIKSCCCFLGKYANLDKCPFCRENRFNARGQARRYFRYTPLIPQLRALFQSSAMAAKLRYRVAAEQDREAGAVTTKSM